MKRPSTRNVRTIAAGIGALAMLGVLAVIVGVHRGIDNAARKLYRLVGVLMIMDSGLLCERIVKMSAPADPYAEFADQYSSAYAELYGTQQDAFRDPLLSQSVHDFILSLAFFAGLCMLVAGAVLVGSPYPRLKHKIASAACSLGILPTFACFFGTVMPDAIDGYGWTNVIYGAHFLALLIGVRAYFMAHDRWMQPETPADLTFSLISLGSPMAFGGIFAGGAGFPGYGPAGYCGYDGPDTDLYCTDHDSDGRPFTGQPVGYFQQRTTDGWAFPGQTYPPGSPTSRP